MAYPAHMQNSLKKAEASRSRRLTQVYQKLSLEEKASLLETYHPDFRTSHKREILVGPNRGAIAPQELAELLESPSRLDAALQRIVDDNGLADYLYVP